MAFKSILAFVVSVGILLPGLARGGGAEVTFSVALTPAGSFVARSGAVSGSARPQGAGFVAENVVLALDTLSTGISLRDRHMKTKYFETAKFPQAKLVRASGAHGAFTGDLQIHGIRHRVAGTYSIEGSLAHGKFKCKLSDFGINPPRYMGVGVEDEVEVEVVLPIAVNSGRVASSR